MRAEFPCPACGASDWRLGASYAYRSHEHADVSSELDDFTRLRRKVLFEVYCPGQDEVILRARWCSHCGFAAYSPRPGESDIAAKYRFLQSAEGDIGGSPASERGRLMERRRAERTYGLVAGHVRAERPSVLDFGGGDGKLLAPFAELGAECHLVDYNVSPLPGIAKLGDTLADVPKDMRFDVIICSHVLEHVAQPRQLAAELGDRLAPEGVLFAEVPLEIWMGLPITQDPVTHVNFFTQSSLEDLLIASGLGILSAASVRGSYGEREKDVAIVLAARERGSDRPRRAAWETEHLMRPGVAARLRTRWRRSREAGARA